jgi:hypothetical protein
VDWKRPWQSSMCRRLRPCGSLQGEGEVGEWVGVW